MSELLVRPRQDADIPACAQALVATHAIDGYPVEGVADPEAWLRPEGLIKAWVGELHGQVVGHALITEPGPGDAAAVMWLANHPEERLAVGGRLFVHPHGRGHGLGLKLMEAAGKYCAEAGYRVVLDVMEKDQAAIELYERLGLQRIGTTEHPDGHGNLIPAVCYVSPA